MPVYEYKVKAGYAGCEACSKSLTTYQSIKDPALTACPKCGAPVERLLFAPGVATPKGPAELKNLGFKKLVRRDSGVYENVTASGSESKVWEADKPSTMPDIKSVISD